jgi:hypothetical protein
MATATNASIIPPKIPPLIVFFLFTIKNDTARCLIQFTSRLSPNVYAVPFLTGEPHKWLYRLDN